MKTIQKEFPSQINVILQAQIYEKHTIVLGQK